jgi:hypothetical protein
MALFNRLFAGSRKAWKNRSLQHRRPFRLAVELLEQREMPAVFTPGNLIVLQAGDSNQYNTQGPLYFNEFTTTPGAAAVQQDAISASGTVGGTGNQPITIDLTAAAGNGQLNRTYDGTGLVFGGVDSTVDNGGYTLPQTPTGSANRVIAVAGNDPAAAGFLNTTTYGPFYVGDDNRGGVAESLTGPVWSFGHPNQAGGAVSQGVLYFPGPNGDGSLQPPGTTGIVAQTGVQVSSQTNIRGGFIGFDNRLYWTTAGSTSLGLAGIYTSTVQARPTGNSPGLDQPVVKALFAASKVGGMYLADVNGDGIVDNGDRIYLNDDGTVGGAGTGGLYMSVFDTTRWGGANAVPGQAAGWSPMVRIAEGVIDDQPTPQNSAQLRGLAGTVLADGSVQLYATEFDNVAGNNSYLFAWNDATDGSLTGPNANKGVERVSSATHSGTTATITLTDALPISLRGTTTWLSVSSVGSGSGTFPTAGGFNGVWHATISSDGLSFTYTDNNSLTDVSGSAVGNGTVGQWLNTGAVGGILDPQPTPASSQIIQTLADGTLTASPAKAQHALRGVSFAPVAATTLSILAVDGTTSETVTPGTTVNFSVHVANPQSGVTLTGLKVTFIDVTTNTSLGQGTIDGSGNASLAIAVTGQHIVKAYFAGGGAQALAPVTSSSTVTVNASGSTASTTTLAATIGGSATTQAAVGRAVTLTATVTSGATGTVSFYNGSALLGSATISGTTATLVTSFSVAGSASITATYNGDATFAVSSSSPAISLTIGNNATASITTSANNVAVLATPTYTATLTGPLGTVAGTVQFFSDGTALGSAQTLSSGAASITSTALSAGSHLITISFTPAATSPYNAFVVDTSTSTNGVALIETARQALTPGNLLAVQRGDGSVNLGSSGYLVFLAEYRPDGTLVQRIALPNADAGTTHAVLLSGQNGSEGLLQQSGNGQYVTIVGYDVPVGRQFVTSTQPYQFARTIARIDAAGNVDTSTSISTTQTPITAATWSAGTATITANNNLVPGNPVTISGMTPAGYNGTYVVVTATSTSFTYALANDPGGAGTAFGTATGPSVPYNPEDVVSNDGTAFWIASSTGTGDTVDSGLLYAPLGSSTATQIGPINHGYASVGIYGTGANAQLATVERGSGELGAPQGLATVGSGLPTTLQATPAGISTLTADGSGNVTVQLSGSSGPAFSANSQVVISGASDSRFNGAWTAATVDTTNHRFTFTSASLANLSASGGTVSAGQALANLQNLEAEYEAVFPTGRQPEQFVFLNTNDGSTNNPNLAYLADQAYGLLKFWKATDGNWHLGQLGTNSFGEKLIFAGGATGVVATIINPGTPLAKVNIYVTGSNVQQANPNQIAFFQDQNGAPAGSGSSGVDQGFSSGSFSTLAFVGGTPGSGAPSSPNGNMNFAGLAFVPGFGAGNIVVDRVGTGSGSLSSSATASFLDQFSNTGVARGSVALPTGGDVSTLTGANWSNGVTTITGFNDYKVGQQVTVSGVTPSLYNGTFLVTGLTGTATSAITGATWSNGLATFTVASNSYVVGQTVTVTGVTPAGYNGARTVTSVTGTTFTVGIATNPGTYTSGGTALGSPTGFTYSLPLSAVATASRATDAVTITAVTWSSVNGVGTVTVTANNTFSAGQTVIISGVSPTAFSGTFVVASATSTSFTYLLGTNPGTASLSTPKATPASPVTNVADTATPLAITAANTASVNASITGVASASSAATITGVSYSSANGGTVTVTANNSFSVGQTVTIANVTPAAFSSTFTIATATSTSFTITNFGANPGTATFTGTATATGFIATATTSAAHNYIVGQTVTISGITPSGYNGTVTVASVPSSTTFTYNIPGGNPGSGTSTGTSAGTFATITVSSVPSGLTGQTVIVANVNGSNNSNYNGSVKVVSTTGTTITYAVATNPGTADLTAGPTVSYNTATVTAANSYAAGNSIAVAGVTGATTLNGTFTILSANSSSFTYYVPSNPITGTRFGTATVLQALTEGGTSTGEGYLTNAQDSHTLEIAGYNQVPGSSTSANNASVGVVNASGVVDVTTQMPSQVNGVRVAVSPDGLGMWVATGTSIRYVPFANTPSQAAITAASWSPANSGTVTITAANNFTAGQIVAVTGLTPTGYNGTVTLLSANSTSFTYALATNPGPATVIAGAVAQLLPTGITNQVSAQGQFPTVVAIGTRNDSSTNPVPAQLVGTAGAQFQNNGTPSIDGPFYIGSGLTTSGGNSISVLGTGTDPNWPAVRDIFNQFPSTNQVAISPDGNTIIVADSRVDSKGGLLVYFQTLAGSWVRLTDPALGGHSLQLDNFPITAASEPVSTANITAVSTNSASITAASWANGTLTLTASNSFTVGQTVILSGFTSSVYNARFTVVSATASSFTVSVSQSSPATPSFTGATALARAANVTVTATNTFVAGQNVTITGNSNSAYNGTFAIASANGTTFTYTLTASTDPGTPGSTATATVNSSALITTASAVDFAIGQTINIAGVDLPAYNTSSAVITSLAGGTTVSPTSLSWANGVVTVTVNNTFAAGNQVTIAGVTPSAYNGTFTILSASGTQFTYALSSNPGTATVNGTATSNFTQFTYNPGFSNLASSSPGVFGAFATGQDGGFRALTADWSSFNPSSGGTVTLYGTTTATSGNRLVKVLANINLTSGNANLSNFTVLATASANTAFRGVAFAPTNPGTTASTTTLSVSGSPGTYGAGVTLTATVTSGATGWVSFRTTAGLEIGSAPLSGNTATLVTTSNLPAGTYSIVAVYTGNATFSTSTSSAQAVTVNQAGTSTSLAFSPNPVATGQTVTLTATVTPNSGTPPTGTVAFTNGATNLGTAAVTQVIVNQGGIPTITFQAAITTSFASAGSFSLTATYSGDTNYTGSNGSNSLNVVTATTTTLTTNVANPGSNNQSLTLTATVTPASGTAAGSVSFYDGSLLVGSQNLSSGVATLNVTTAPFQSITITHGSEATTSGTTTVTFTTDASLPSYLAGKSVVIESIAQGAVGVSGNPTNYVGGYNGTFTIASVSGNSFTVTNNNAAGLPDDAVGGMAIIQGVLTPGAHSLQAIYNPGANAFGISTGVHEQAVAATAFNASDVFVQRLGDGITTLNTQAPLTFNGSVGATNFVDEFTPAGVLVQTFALPSADSQSFAISAASGTGTTVTITTAAPNDFATGDKVTIAGITGGSGTYNGDFVITRVNSTQFTYSASGSGSPTVTTATAQGAVHAVVGHGQQSTTGQMTLSGDGQYLFIGGYDQNPNPAGTNFASLQNVSGSTVPRSIARIKFDGTVDTLAFNLGISTTGLFNAIYSPDGNKFYLGGSSSGNGIYYFPAFTTSASLQGSSTGNFLVNPTQNVIGVESYNGTLYYIGGGSNSGTNFRLAQVGPTGALPIVTAITAASWASNTVTITANNNFQNGQSVIISGMTPSGYNGTFTISNVTPTSFQYTLATNPGTATVFGTASNGVISTLNGIPTDTSTLAQPIYNAVDAYFTHLNGAGNALDTIYVSDRGSGFGQGSITKWSLVGSTWQESTVALPYSNTVPQLGFYYLSGKTTGGSVVLYSTYGNGGNADFGPGFLYATADTSGYNTAPGIPITAASFSSGTATITAAPPAGFSYAVGSWVTVTGVNPSGYNGRFQITAVSGNTFSYALGSNPGSYISGGTALSITTVGTVAPGPVGGPWYGAETIRSPGGTPQAQTTTLVDNGPNSSTVQQPITLTVTVASPGSINLPTGTVTLEDASNGNAVVGTGSLSNGSFTFNVAAGALASGTHNLFVVYAGDSYHQGQNSNTVSQTVNQVVFFASANYTGVDANDSVTLTVTRTDTSGAASVHYYTTDGTAVSGTDFVGIPQGSPATLNFAAGQGSATITITTLATADYAGTRAFTVTLVNPSTGVTLSTPSTANVTLSDPPTQVVGSPVVSGNMVDFTFNRPINPATAVRYNGGGNFGSVDFALQLTATITAASWSSGTVTITTSAAHGLAAGQQVTISGMTPSGYNGTVTVNSVTDATHFTYSLATDPGAATAFGTATGSNTDGSLVFDPSSNNKHVTFVATALSTTGVITGASWASNTVTITTSTSSVPPHGYQVGQSVVISGMTPSGYNGTYTITSVPSFNSFTYTLNTNPGTATGFGTAYDTPAVLATGSHYSLTLLGTGASSSISAASWASGTATITTSSAPLLGFSPGARVVISGMTPSGYNGTFTITAVNSPTQFTFSLATNPGTATAFGTANSAVAWTGTNGPGGGVLAGDGTNTGTNFVFGFTDGIGPALTLPSFARGPGQPVNLPDTFTIAPGGATWASNTVTITTLESLSYAVGQQVTISGITPSGYNGTYTITGEPTATSFTYTLNSNPGTVTSTSAATASIASGIPVFMTGVDAGHPATSVTFTLTYDPTILTPNFAGATLSQAASSAGLILDAPVLVAGGDAHHTTYSFNIHTAGAGWSPAGNPLPPLLNIPATVPTTAPYFTKADIILSSVMINSQVAVANSGVEVAAYFGDTDGNQRITAQDGSLIAQVAANKSTGFDKYQHLDPVIISDTDANGRLSGQDQSFVLQAAAGLAAPLPAVPSTAVNISTATWSSGTVTITTSTAPVLPYAIGQQVFISGMVPAGYNGVYTIASVISTTSFTYALASNPGTATTFGTVTNFVTGADPRLYIVNVQAGVGQTVTVAVHLQNTDQFNITAASWSGGAVTITTASPHGYTPGQQVTIGGMTPNGYNGTFSIASVPSATTFTYSLASDPGTATAFGTASLVENISSLDEAILFDPNVYTVSNVRTGSLLTTNGATGWSTTANVNNTQGFIRVAQATSSPTSILPGVDGDVLLYDVTVNTNVAVGTTSSLNLADHVTSGGSTTITDVNTNAGPLTLNPAPTNAGNDPVDGTLTVVPPSGALSFSNVNAVAGGTFVAHLNFTNGPVLGISMSSLDEAILFDPAVLQVVSTTQGAGLSTNGATGWSTTDNVNNTQGFIRVAQATSSPTSVATGEVRDVYDITFQVNANATGSTVVNLADHVTSNGSTTITDVNQNSGPIVLNPAPTNAATDPVDGIVTIVLVPNQPPFNSLPAPTAIPKALFNPAARAGLHTATANTVVLSTGNGDAIMVSDSDANGGNETTTLTLSGTGVFGSTGSVGTLTLASTSGLTVSGNNTASVTITGTLANINSALNGLIYTPGAGFFGTATLTVSTNDNGNSGFGGAQTDTRSTSITVVGLLLSEIFLNSTSNLGTPSANQYLEIFSTVPNYAIPSNVYMVGIQGNNSEVVDTFANDTVNTPGDVTDVFKLGGFTTGSNGYLALLEKNQPYSGGTGLINSAGTVLANTGTQSGFGNGGGSSVFGSLTGVHLGQDQNGVGVRLGTNPDLPGDGATANGELSWDMPMASSSYLLIQAPTAPSVQTTTTSATNIDGGSTATATVAGGTAYNSWNVIDGVGILASPLSPTLGGTYTQLGPDRSYAPMTFQSATNVGTLLSGSNFLTTGTSASPWTANYVGRIGQFTGSSSADWLASIPTGTTPNFVLGTNTSNSNYSGQKLNNIGGPNFWADQMKVVVNDGTSNQHSQVSELTLTFASPVTLNGIASQFTITAATDNGSGAGTATVTTSVAHNFVVGQSVSITGVTGTGWTGQKLVTAVTANTVTFARGTITANGTLGATPRVTALNTTTTGGANGSTTFANIFQVLGTANIISTTESGTTVTITTAVHHNFSVGQQVTISGVSVNGYNGTFAITAVTATTFSYTAGSSGLGNATGGTAGVPVQALFSIPTGGGSYSASAGTGTNVTVLVVRFLATGNLTVNFTNADPLGNKVGLNDGNYFLNTTASLVTDAQGHQLDGDHDGNYGGNGHDEFWRLFGDINGDRYVDALDAYAFGKSEGTTSTAASFNISSASESGNTVTITTTGANTFVVGQRVTIAGVGTGYNGTFIITSVNGNSFTYTSASSGLATVNNQGTAANDTADYVWYLDNNEDGNVDVGNNVDSTAFFNNRYGINGGIHHLLA